MLRKIQEKYEPSDYLLSGDFRPTEPRTMENRFKKVLKTCGIREVHFHVLRHTFASQCIESGMDIKALSEILGHSSVKITIDRYVHLTMKFKQHQIMILHFPEKKCAV
ncbi:MAG: tyrosine-type recombinase/integrase [Clostridia bacterium]